MKLVENGNWCGIPYDCLDDELSSDIITESEYDDINDEL